MAEKAMPDKQLVAADSTAVRVASTGLADAGERQQQAVEKSARASGTPFLSFFSPPEMLALACEAGFRQVRHVSAADLTERYFSGRSDCFRPPASGEAFLVATT